MRAIRSISTKRTSIRPRASPGKRARRHHHAHPRLTIPGNSTSTCLASTLRCDLPGERTARCEVRARTRGESARAGDATGAPSRWCRNFEALSDRCRRSPGIDQQAGLRLVRQQPRVQPGRVALRQHRAAIAFSAMSREGSRGRTPSAALGPATRRGSRAKDALLAIDDLEQLGRRLGRLGSCRGTAGRPGEARNGRSAGFAAAPRGRDRSAGCGSRAGRACEKGGSRSRLCTEKSTASRKSLRTW